MDENVRGQIERTIKNNKVVLFMKGNRSFPQCGFSATVVSLLNPLVSKYETVNVLADPKIRDGIKEYSQWPTIPQLYVDGEFVGGCDIVKAMHASGELAKLFGGSATTTAAAAPATPATAPAITLSPTAAQAFTAAAADAPGQVLRMEANAQFQYELFFGDRLPGDLVATSAGLAIHVDAASAPRLDGVSIDFVEDARGAGFKIVNPQEPARVKQLTAKALKGMMDDGAKLALFDVRTPDEHKIASIEGAQLLDAAGQARLAGLDRATTVVLHCHHGGRSQRAAEQLIAEGYKDVYNLEGGIDAWSQTVDSKVPRY
jgi:monothiol glutaredoxin